MIKLNGYWYNNQEVKEALEKKGYVVQMEQDGPDRRGNITTVWLAVKNGSVQSMQSAAIEEFHKKPLLQ